ncbi:hypothetical protein [Microbacterium invictum]|uniref:Uncharacterized protein n=1 Tax=Microbacterium invictum TaxID=515415 RepID=A0AA40SN08_9MICO|nr:hypothetical protein [Microbacterium invictum]MBB4139235.1 hypothetical protein [Microbacterium invictum]
MTAKWVRWLIAASAVLILAGAGAGLAFALSQPTPIERAGAECAGNKPLLRLSATEDSADKPAKDNAEGLTDEEAGELFDEYFDGVVSVEDGGQTLIVATKPQDDDVLGVSSLALTCVQESLEMPKWLIESMGQTRSLDGRLSGEWDSFSAQWSYHPDNGVNLIIVQK